MRTANMRVRSCVGAGVSFLICVGGTGANGAPTRLTSALPTVSTFSPLPSDFTAMSGNGRYVITDSGTERSHLLDRTTGDLTTVVGLVTNLSHDGRFVSSRRQFTSPSFSEPLYIIDRSTRQGWRVVDDPAGVVLEEDVLSADGKVVAVGTRSQTGGRPTLILGRRGGTSRTIATSGRGLATYPKLVPLQLSADGRYLLYAARCSLVCPEPLGRGELRVLDTIHSTTRIVSRSTTGVESNADEGIGAISPDGRYVIWPSMATNLVPDATATSMKVYLRDLRTSRTRLLPYPSTSATEYVRSIAVSNAGLAMYQGWRRAGTREFGTVIAYDVATGQSANLGVDSTGAPVNAAVALGSVTPDGQHGSIAGPPDVFIPGARSALFDLGVSGNAFVPASLLRVLDTRAAVGVSTRTPVRANTEVVVHVEYPDGTPISSPIAAINLVAVKPTMNANVTVYPCGQGPSGTSSINVAKNAVIANLVRVGLNSNGNFCVRSSAAIHLVADLVFLPELDFLPGTTLTRVLDTRLPSARPTKLAAGEDRRVAINGVNGLMKGHTPMAVNVTVTESASAGSITLHPCGSDPGAATSLTFRAHQTKASFGVAYTDIDGFTCVRSTAAAHVIIDVQSATPDPADFTAAATILDTAVGKGGPIEAGVVRVIDLDPADLSTSRIPLYLRLTASNTGADGSIRVYRCGQDPPSTTAMDVSDGAGPVAAITYAETAANGDLCVVSSAPTDLMIERGALGDGRASLTPRQVLAPVRVLAGRTMRLGTFTPEALVSVKATAAAGGFVTVHSCTDDRTRVSSLNLAAGDQASNVVPVHGEMCLFASTTMTISADIVGEVFAGP